jgi:hypothetical protein
VSWIKAVHAQQIRLHVLLRPMFGRSSEETQGVQSTLNTQTREIARTCLRPSRRAYRNPNAGGRGVRTQGSATAALTRAPATLKDAANGLRGALMVRGTIHASAAAERMMFGGRRGRARKRGESAGTAMALVTSRVHSTVKPRDRPVRRWVMAVSESCQGRKFCEQAMSVAVRAVVVVIIAIFSRMELYDRGSKDHAVCSRQLLVLTFGTIWSQLVSCGSMSSIDHDSGSRPGTPRIITFLLKTGAEDSRECATCQRGANSLSPDL